MPSDIQTDLIIRARNGDNAVIGAIYERFRLSVFRYLYYRTSDKQAAEDLTSDVFLRMVRSIPSYRPGNVTFQAWLFQIARNIAIDYYRKMKFRNHVELAEDVPAGDEDLDTSVDRNLTHARLKNALEHLTEDQRDVIVLRFVANMPIAQVAQTLHKSEDAIKGLQRRGLLALREILVDWEITYAGD